MNLLYFYFFIWNFYLSLMVNSLPFIIQYLTKSYLIFLSHWTSTVGDWVGPKHQPNDFIVADHGERIIFSFN
jgi:hypothetical protein